MPIFPDSNLYYPTDGYAGYDCDEDGNLRPDNNSAENAIRPFLNWLFSGHPNGAQASCVLYSLVESAKLEPYAYLKLIFERIPLARSENDSNKLLPKNITEEIPPA